MKLKMCCHLNTELKINTLTLRIFKIVHCFKNNNLDVICYKLNYAKCPSHKKF